MFHRFLVAMFTLVCVSTARADDLADTAARLALITNAATQICGSVEAHGDSAQASGDISVALHFLSTHLGVNADTEQYNGVVRTDALAYVNNTQQCRTHIVDTLTAILFRPQPYTPTPAPLPSPEIQPAPPAVSLKRIKVCPMSGHNGYFAVSIYGNENSVFGWYRTCAEFTVTSSTQYVYVSFVEATTGWNGDYNRKTFTISGRYVDSSHLEEHLQLPACVVDAQDIYEGYASISDFRVDNGKVLTPCSGKMENISYFKYALDSQSEYIWVSSIN